MSQLTTVGGTPLALNVTSTLNDLLDKTIKIGARLVGFAVVLVVGWLVARFVAALATRLLRRTSLDRVAERNGVARWAGRQGPSGLIGRLLYYVLGLVTLQLAFSVFGPNLVSDLLDAVIRWLPGALVGLAILVVAAVVGRIARTALERQLQIRHGRMLARTAQILIIAVGAVAALTQAGVGAAVTMPVLIAVLASVVGVIIVGVGGGLVAPMRDRWDRALTWVDIERGRREYEKLRAEQEREDRLAAERDRAEQTADQPVAAEPDRDGAPAPAPAHAAEDTEDFMDAWVEFDRTDTGPFTRSGDDGAPAAGDRDGRQPASAVAHRDRARGHDARNDGRHAHEHRETELRRDPEMRPDPHTGEQPRVRD